jgi:uncharacterized protein YggU (UPF0235/DUF167 family)
MISPGCTDRLKIRLTAPPVEGKANAYLMGFLAKAFGVSRALCSPEQKRVNPYCQAA